jgi:hypothetical protein
MENPAEGAIIETPATFGAALTNFSSGKNFMTAGFKGKLALIVNMLQWRPACKDQQIQRKSLLEKQGMPANLVMPGLHWELPW